jgi:hypothetical protein
MAGKDRGTMVKLQRKDTEGHEVVKGILVIVRMHNEWSHDRQQSQTLTEGEFDDLWQQADKNLNALAGWEDSETLQHLKRTRNDISQEVISDQAHKVPQNDQQQRKKARTTAKNGE